LLHSRADSTRELTPPLLSTFSKDSILKSEVMNSYQQAICKSIETPKNSNTQQALLFAALS